MSFDGTDYPKMTEEQTKARKKRNMVLAAGIVGFMLLIFAITVVRIQEGVVRDQDWAAETGGNQPVDGVQSGQGAPPVSSDGDAE
ncbi:MAG: hypothetical protein CMK09_06385 [Ponticaulis sp.]|nr:hypothetical protein [Ponticaulis sp.]|tara:strand:- start:636 stop:890 length:255 start_codon:yes stop_codon:yes gene_type:complete